MRWYTHIMFGSLLVVLILPFVENIYLFSAVVLFSALLPDIDQKDARIHRYLPFTRWVQSVFEHRGFFHSVFPAVLLFVVPFSFGFLEAGLALLLGYCSHLVIDGITVKGIYPLYPLTHFHVKGFVKVGGFVEHMLFFMLVFLVSGWFLFF